MTRTSLAQWKRPAVIGPRVVPIGLTAVALIGAAALGVWAWQSWYAASATSSGQVPAAAPATPNTTEVHLTQAKLAAADLHCTAAEIRTLRETRRVPGTIGYNKTQRLEVTMPVAGVVKQVRAEPGQAVKQGDTLALLTSIEVGIARDEVVSAEAEAQLARKESQWASQIYDHMQELLGALNDRLDPTELEELFDKKVLGKHRNQIFTAYSKLRLAERTAKNTDAVAGDGIAEIIVRQRRSEREVAAAALASIREQTEFEAMQDKTRKQAALAHAERLVTVAQRKLAVLLGPFAEIARESDDDELCELVLRAPSDGLIEDRLVTRGVHTLPAQVLFTIADTNTLWVSAQIYEREWAAFNASQVTELTVESPAVPDHELQAKVLFVSVGVSPETRAVPLVAEIDNEDGRFKPGMFAWVALPLGMPREGLAVPSSALTRHEERPFVFVEVQPGTYRKVDVTVGLETPELIEITHGLQPGDKVVDRGVFLLKSELLLIGDDS